MLNAITTQKLEQLGLKGMLRTLEYQQQQPEISKLCFEERLGMLVDAELSDRDNRKIDRLLKAAKLRHFDATLEAVNYKAGRNLDRSVGIVKLSRRQLGRELWHDQSYRF